MNLAQAVFQSQGYDEPKFSLALKESLNDIPDDANLLCTRKDIQDLAISTGFSDIEARAALVLHKGDQQKSFKHLLSNIVFNIDYVLSFIDEYADWRGLRISDSMELTQVSEISKLKSSFHKILTSVHPDVGIINKLMNKISKQSPSLIKPDIVFCLQAYTFIQYLHKGDVPSALSFLRDSLTPLANNDESLTPILKKLSTACIIYKKEDLLNFYSSLGVKERIDDLFSSINGFTEPTLISILKWLLKTHQYLNQGQIDQYGELLHISRLNKSLGKVPMFTKSEESSSERDDMAMPISEPPSSLNFNSLERQVEATIQARRSLLFSDRETVPLLGNENDSLDLDEDQMNERIPDPSETPGTNTNVEISDEAIETLIDMMALTRSEARALLIRHNGSLGEVLNILFN
ncbi:hypothetical protein ROZALSC1DRAFT_27542 [Rozella allomycis CSF55]|uniref:Uncharacterized protein n=1 Tax=Rozella allomycis (strain CSF55) TaxID=988480 RepID=A0A4P9YPN4_ROZAC|nr:hypothetical protein ROZALSC1DRAFT_27542 [Rozella allomycis CSF55]